MPGPLKNARHERFAQEYLVWRDVDDAATAAGVELKSVGSGFYVYFLVDGRDSSIFYIGKGKGQRVSHHRRSAHNPSSTNQVKAKRIVECGDALRELVFCDEMDEVSAFRLEKELIARLRHCGLTNISSGSVHPLESVLAGIDASMGMIRSYDDWIACARPKQLEAAISLSGSTRAFYDLFWLQFEQLRRHVDRELNSIKGKFNGPEGR